jgi:hypothetical protein
MGIEPMSEAWVHLKALQIVISRGVGPSLYIDASIPTLLCSPRLMALQQLLLQRVGDKEPTRFQSLKNLWEIAHEPHPVRAFQDTQRPRKGEFPAQSNSASDLLIY